MSADDSLSELQGACIAPFLDLTKFSDEGCKRNPPLPLPSILVSLPARYLPPPLTQVGNEANTTDHLVPEGRICQKLSEDVTCCLPCPSTEWLYPSHFSTLSDVANWISVVSAVACVFLLVSYIFLPVEKTGRHYLNISIVCAVMFMNVSLL